MVVQRFLRKNWVFIVVLFFTAIGGFFRFYQLRERLYFQLDEERDWHMIRRAVVYRRPPLIGSYLPPGLYLGPLWFYVSSAIGFVNQLDPFSFGFLASFIGTSTVPVFFFVGKELFHDWKIALTASLLYASSYLVSIYSRIWWPLIFSPIATLFTYFSLSQMRQRKLSWAWPMFLSLTLALHGEPPNLTTLIVVIASFLLLGVPWKNKHVIAGFLLLVLSHLPVLAFEFKHGFAITQSLTRFAQEKFFSPSQETPIGSVVPQIVFSLSRIIYPSGRLETSAQIGWCTNYLSERMKMIPSILLVFSFLLLVSTITIALSSWKNRSFGFRLLSLHLVVLIGGLVLFSFSSGTPIYEWFFYHLFPTFILLWSLAIWSVLKHRVILALLLIAAIISMNVHANLVATNPHGLSYRRQAMEYALSIIPNNESFSIESLGRCFAWSGYRTLSILENRMPSKSYLDDLFGNWLYPLELYGETPRWAVIFVDHERYPLDTETILRYRTATERATQRARFGVIEVLLQKIE